MASVGASSRGIRNSVVRPPPTAGIIGVPQTQTPISPTYGLATPELVRSQQKNYENMVDAQLSQGMRVLQQQLSSAKDMLRQQASHKIAEYSAQVDLEVSQQKATLDQKWTAQSMSLKQKKLEKQGELEHHADLMKLSYEQHQTHKDIGSQQKEMEQTHRRMSRALEEESTKLKGMGAGAPLVPSHIHKRVSAVNPKPGSTIIHRPAATPMTTTTPTATATTTTSTTPTPTTAPALNKFGLTGNLSARNTPMNFSTTPTLSNPSAPTFKPVSFKSPMISVPTMA